MSKRKRVGDQELEQQAEPQVPAWLGGDELEASTPVQEADQPSGFRDRVVELKRIPASQIENAPWNFRRHPDQQKAALAGSISELGFFKPLDVWCPEPGRYMLVDGQARRDLIEADIGPETLVPINVTDLDEQEAKKALLVGDPLSAMAESDPKYLDALLKEIQTDDEALAKMLTDLAQDAGVIPPEALANTAGLDPPEIVEDEVPEPPAVPITKPGDLWLMGDVHYECEACGKRYTLDEGKAMDGWCPCTPREAA